MEVVASSVATIEATITDQDGEPAAPTAPVTVHVVDSAGSDVVAAGTAASVTGTTISAALTAAQTALLDQFTATFTDNIGRTAEVIVDIVGGVYATIGQIRASDPSLTIQRFSDDRIRQVRQEVQAEFESAQGTGVAWVPRFTVERVQWVAPQALIELPDLELRRVRWMRVYNTPTSFLDMTDDTLQAIPPDPLGFIRTARRLIVWGSEIEIGYEHGMDRPPPDLLDAFMVRMRHRLNLPASGIPDRATSIQTEQGGIMSLSTPGLRGAVTGIPTVDVVLGRRRRTRPGVG